VVFPSYLGLMARAVAVPLHRGRTTVTAQTSLYDAEQRLVARTTQIQAVRPVTAGPQ
jgi:acyl-coenzyme A thioesterase PaaI-like protein